MTVSLSVHVLLRIVRPLAHHKVLDGNDQYMSSVGFQVLPPVFRSIGIYVFASPPPLMLPLGALLLLAAVIAGHARSSAVLAFCDRQASCS